MEQLKIPMGYHADLNLHDTQVAIKTVKDFFQQNTCTEAEPSACLRTYICRSKFRPQ